MLYSTPNASWLVTAGIAALAVLVVLLGSTAYAVAARTEGPGVLNRLAFGRALAFGTLWMTLAGMVAASGLLLRSDTRPPPFAWMFLALLGVGLVLGLGRVGRTLSALPFAMLIGFQAFRLPLELVMHQAAVEGVMPVQMSFQGFNFDILTGLTSIPVAYLAARGRAPRALIWAWNLLGSALLLVILGVALASSPGLKLFGSAPAQVNTWVAHVPFVYLPAVLVVAALAGHLILWRKLLAQRHASGEAVRAPHADVRAVQTRSPVALR